MVAWYHHGLGFERSVFLAQSLQAESSAIERRAHVEQRLRRHKEAETWSLSFALWDSVVDSCRRCDKSFWCRFPPFIDVDDGDDDNDDYRPLIKERLTVMDVIPVSCLSVAFMACFVVAVTGAVAVVAVAVCCYLCCC